MSRWPAVLIVALLASVPLWMNDLYILHILITTAIMLRVSRSRVYYEEGR